PDQERIAKRMQDLMAERPFREGVVASVSARSVSVRYQVARESRAARFAPDEVFFFQPDGRAATAASQPGLLHTGDRVLVPTPRGEAPDEAAAAPTPEGGLRDGAVVIRPVPARPKAAPSKRK